MHNLKTIKLSFLSIDSIDDEGFKTFPALENIEMYRTVANVPLRKFDLNWFPTNLKSLSLKYNNISEIPCETLKRFSALESLTLSGLYLKEIDLACLPQNLVELDLSSNGEVSAFKKRGN